VANTSTNLPKNKLIAIVGETGSGKSGLALALAERYGGEIICADSRTVYEGMDIGTAKPSAADQQRVPHHLLDIVRPDQPYNASDFKAHAEAVMRAIWARGHTAFLVGGTGLYVDAVIYDYAFRPAHAADEREKLENLSVEALQSVLKERDIELPENDQNPRHLIRAIETNGAVAVKKGLMPGSIVIGLKVPGSELERRIEQRVDTMLAAGLETEVRQLAERYGWATDAMTAVGYAEWRPYLAGAGSLQDVRQNIITHTIQYAKRQRTWFKRNKNIQWVESAEEADKIVARFVSEGPQKAE